MAPEPFGKYELLERIAAGGMAEIFRARYQPAPGVTKQVVIKKILPHYAENAAFISMFTNEARIAMGLSHGNIAQVFDFGNIDGDVFIAMEFVDGQPLSKLIKRAKALGFPALPPEFAAFIASEMLRALHYAHTRNDDEGRPLHIIHRDVSPQNVLLSYEGQVKLVDFGIARARTEGRDEGDSGAMKGKYSYFSPEQARSKELDARSDVFSAGIVLYEMLTGRLPFAGKLIDVLARIVRADYLAPRAINPMIPEALEKIVLKALAVEKSDRYQTAEAFHEELSTFVSASWPDFAPSHLATLLQLLFEQELTQQGRQAQVAPTFVQRIQGWKAQATVSPAPPDDDDIASVMEAEPPTEMAHLGAMGPQPPTGTSISQVSGTSVTTLRSRRVTSVVLAVAAALIGFAAVFLVIRLNHGTLEVVSTPSGATVWLDGIPVSQTTPFQIPSLRSGRTYRLEVRLDGHLTWQNDIPLAGGQHLIVNAVLEKEPPPAPVEPAPGPSPGEPVAGSDNKEPEPSTEQGVTISEATIALGPPPVPSVQHAADGSIELDLKSHAVSLTQGGAFSAALDLKQTYKIWLSKGSTNGWLFFVENPAGAQVGALGTLPMQIRGASKLYVACIPSSITGLPGADERRPRQLWLQTGRGRPRAFNVKPVVTLSKENTVLVDRFSPKKAYTVTLEGKQPTTPVVIAHPRLGVVPLGTSVVLRNTERFRIFSLVSGDQPTTRLKLQVNELTAPIGARR